MKRPTPEKYKHDTPFKLESGNYIYDLELAYHTFGKLNEKKDNVIWVFHALTANSDVIDWWPSLFGADLPIDPKDYFIICVNTLGSYYGSTGPRSINPDSNESYGLSFPDFTVRDVVATQLLLANHLNIQKVKLALGGSFGGFQALEFAIMFPGKIDNLALLVTSAKETAWSIAIHESQRLSLTADQSFFGNEPTSGQDGLRAARGIGLLTYRTYEVYKQSQTDDDDRLTNFRASAYIRYQGDKLVKRFHAHCYWYLGRCLDTHNIGRGRGGLEKVLNMINIPTQVIGIQTDRLVPTAEQHYIASHIPDSEFIEIQSAFGHDGFLIEGTKIGSVLNQRLNEKK